MDFGFSANAFRDYGPVETVEILADAGYDGVELLFDQPHLYPPETDEEDVAELRRALDDDDLAISNCNAFMLTAIEGFHHPSYVEPDAEYRQKRIDYTREALHLADAFDAEYISIEPGGPIPDGKSREWAMETFVQSLNEVIPTAEELGVDLLVEPEPDLLIETTDQFLEFVDMVDSSAVGCNFDAGHLFCVGEDPAAAVETLGEYADHYHVEDIPADRSHEHTQLGAGAMDIDAFLEAVEASGYDGFVTVELYPYQETAEETARDAMSFLAEHGWT
ncbi:sugar phosphate isomerase/epimerase [Halorussus sp. MSC15.2]|uniref:sugar phosphate isomerase/epimerase family protein n=1 Tax=Halorussus sp. MSC15.2 TaxID=2283638 RepID=UPI0013D8BEDB|nr:sugar phosphate isomerase/epimerase family protein [Halorussus sp. MSC15.2]NEU55484.1 sugar phosphate isomerase/epimerase [Halorussus sp. MSC15.2]